MNVDDSINLDDLAGTELEPRTWYSFVQAQIELLRTHVHGLESQIDQSVKAYEKGRVVTDVVEHDDGYVSVILEEHRGIEGPPNHLEEIFEYYFPNLLRRSTLVIVFSFFEHQLNQLCDLFATTHQLNIVYTDLRDTGIDRSRRYLRKVIRLALDDNSANWQELKKIQKVRNIVVHNDAKLDLKPANKDVLGIVKASEYLSQASDSESSYYYHFIDDDEINILKGYLSHVLDTCDSYCSELNIAIDSCLTAIPNSSRAP